MDNSSLTIGWIGHGVMGKYMCLNLINNAKVKPLVYNRTKSKTDDAISQGAIYASPEEIAKQCDIIFIMLGYPSDVKNMLLNKEAIVNSAKSGAIIVDHTTNSPSLTKEIYEKSKEKGISFIDAPVSGGDTGAKNGTIVVMCGGDKEPFEKVQPFMKHYAKEVRLMGGSGAGQSTKMSNQVLLANTIMGVTESLLYAVKAGLDADEVVDLIKGGAAGSFILQNWGPRILKKDLDPGFFVEHFVKDMGIVLEECRRMNLCLAGINQVNELYKALMAQGGEKLGVQALILTLQKMNNVDIYNKKGEN